MIASWRFASMHRVFSSITSIYSRPHDVNGPTTRIEALALVLNRSSDSRTPATIPDRFREPKALEGARRSERERTGEMANSGYLCRGKVVVVTSLEIAAITLESQKRPTDQKINPPSRFNPPGWNGGKEILFDSDHCILNSTFVHSNWTLPLNS